jgi:hypothetical protein
MTDKEMLELAAKAAGIYIEFDSDGKSYIGNDYVKPWNPLTDDGDALRLAVKLNIFNTRSKGYEWPVIEVFIEHNDDPYEATRRAIVRAAAEIGKAM